MNRRHDCHAWRTALEARADYLRMRNELSQTRRYFNAARDLDRREERARQPGLNDILAAIALGIVIGSLWGALAFAI